MNKHLIYRLLGVISHLLGASMALSLPWAFPSFGHVDAFDQRATFGLLGAMFVCIGVGVVLLRLGRNAKGNRLYRREAMAVVGLSWILAMLLGALPFLFSRTCTARDAENEPVPMSVVDALFESASGFTGTGATVLTKLQDKELVSPALLFWRAETHFLGGLGIMVLFVAILGYGSAGKTLLLTEMPGPAQESPHATSRYAARVFAAIFIGLTAILTLLLVLQDMSCFDALCHSFAAIATGGFSNYDASVAHFNSPGIDFTLVVFMFLACTNFTLLYYVIVLRPAKLFGDAEFRVYASIILVAATAIIGFGLYYGDFHSFGGALRYGLFQVTSIMTNTGFGTCNSDAWCDFSRAVLLILMFIGGCAGSTSCSIKVIRHMFLVKALRIELEKAFRPSVVRRVRMGRTLVEDADAVRGVLVYFCLFLVVAVVGWMGLVALEPDETWARTSFEHQKLLDCGSAVAATLNGVGPGLGIVGATQNYNAFHPLSKLILTSLMLLGRLELFVPLVLFSPRFWRR